MVDNLTQLYMQLQSAIDSSLAEEVAMVVKEEIHNSVYNDVYSAGTPNYYERRKDSGGLSDINQMNETVVSGLLTVTDDAGFSTGLGGVDTSMSLAANIQEGYGNKDMWFNEPRPFIDDATNELESSGKVRNALAQGLNTRLGAGVAIVT